MDASERPLIRVPFDSDGRLTITGPDLALIALTLFVVFLGSAALSEFGPWGVRGVAEAVATVSFVGAIGIGIWSLAVGDIFDGDGINWQAASTPEVIVLGLLVVIPLAAVFAFTIGISIFYLGAFTVWPAYVGYRWIRRARRILQQVGSDYDDDGLRVYEKSSSHPYYLLSGYRVRAADPERDVRAYRLHKGVRGVVCAYVRDGQVVFCDREGFDVRRLPRALRKPLIPLDPDDFPPEAHVTTRAEKSSSSVTGAPSR